MYKQIELYHIKHDNPELLIDMAQKIGMSNDELENYKNQLAKANDLNDSLNNQFRKSNNISDLTNALTGLILFIF